MLINRRHIFLKNKELISHFSFKPPLAVSSELNNEACFIIPINAVGKIYRQDGKKDVSQNEGVLMRCGHYVNKWGAINDGEIAEVIIIRFFPDILNSILETDISSSLNKIQSVKRRVSSAKIELDELLRKYLDSLMFYFENPQLVTDELAMLKIKELTLLLLNSKQDNPINELILNLFQPIKYSLKEIVDANLFEDLSMDELASLSNMSTPTFKRNFKKHMEISPGQYINNKRLESAAAQLRNTSKNILEIAFDCGFNDANYFSKAFSKKYGSPPSQFRKA